MYTYIHDLVCFKQLMTILVQHVYTLFLMRKCFTHLNITFGENRRNHHSVTNDKFRFALTCSSLFNCLKKKKLITMYNCTCLTISTKMNKAFQSRCSGNIGLTRRGQPELLWSYISAPNQVTLLVNLNLITEPKSLINKWE